MTSLSRMQKNGKILTKEQKYSKTCGSFEN